MDNLTHNLNEMIAHQRQAERTEGDLQDYHHREAMRCRLMAPEDRKADTDYPAIYWRVVEFELRIPMYEITQEITAEELETSNLSPAELSSLIDLVQAQIEYHRDEIVRLRPILRRLQERVPDDYNHLIEQVREVLNNLD